MKLYRSCSNNAVGTCLFITSNDETADLEIRYKKVPPR